MPLEPEALFGVGFYQDESIIRISKADLNLSAQNYKAEVLLIALILRALQPFEGVVTGNEQTVTGNGQFVTYKNRRASDRLELFFWQRGFFTNKAGQPIAKASYVLEIYGPIYDETKTVSVGDLE